jgi:hypothetical protein
MSSNPPAPSSPTTHTPTETRALLRNAAWGVLIVSPIIILLPPRKFDVYTVALLSGTLISANHLTYEYSGRSFAQRWGQRMEAMSGGTLPPKALETQERLRREKAARFEKQLAGTKYGANAPETKAQSAILDSVASAEGKEDRGTLQKIWYGQEGPDWKKKRDEKEKEALEEGKGYGGLIADQIWEVWNWGRGKAEDIKGKDEEVVEEERRNKEEGKK